MLFDSYTKPSLLTVKEFSRKYPSFPEGGLRHLIFNSSERKNSRGEVVSGNGMEEQGVLVRVGRKILIDEDKFFSWIESQNKK